MKKVLKTRGVFFERLPFLANVLFLEGKNILKKWNVMKNCHENVILGGKNSWVFPSKKSDPKRIGGFVEFLGEPES